MILSATNTEPYYREYRFRMLIPLLACCYQGRATFPSMVTLGAEADVGRIATFPCLVQVLDDASECWKLIGCQRFPLIRAKVNERFKPVAKVGSQEFFSVWRGRLYCVKRRHT